MCFNVCESENLPAQERPFIYSATVKRGYAHLARGTTKMINQFQNASSRISVQDGGIKMEVRDSQQKNASRPMYSWFLENRTYERFRLKAPSSILRTVTASTFSQWLKVYAGITWVVVQWQPPTNLFLLHCRWSTLHSHKRIVSLRYKRESSCLGTFSLRE